MTDFDDAQAQVDGWLQPRDDASAPCGPDLEYDNDFLALTQAALGKPESQFGAAQVPDWLAVRSGAEALLERSRDLRLALYWLRSGLRLHGYSALPPGLQLVTGLVEQHWDHVHPLPDPDDGDPYARISALTLLCEADGVMGDLRACRVVHDRAVGEITGRSIELATGLAQPVGEEIAPGREPLARMLAAAAERTPELRSAVHDAVERVRALQAAVNDKLGASVAPDLRPLQGFANAVAALLPEPGAGDAGAAAAGFGGGAQAGGGRALSGSVGSRDDALRAIDMVCEYLERTEPSNPAPLFLRRARQLVNHNFLQLMKELAPTVMPDLARMVGVDPDTVETPERP